MQIKTAYEQAAARRFPEQVVIAIAKDAAGKHNPITLGWTMLASHEPPMIAIAVGKTRHSLEAIREAKEFVVAFPSAAMAVDAVFHGTQSGRDLDKLKMCGTKTQPATAIDSVLFADAVANFECRLVGEQEAGDHIIFIGQVVAAHMNQDGDVRRLYTLGNERLGGVTV
jgi:flavin reductase (DIM6/NTAB) family NADH-FMN oxidoreductase RutF